MQAQRVIKVIDSNQLDELSSYKGQKVEIIILPLESDTDKTQFHFQQLKKLKGSLPSLMDGLLYQEKIRNEWKK
jgi:hypothetical protein